jgi:hypothetical protein
MELRDTTQDWAPLRAPMPPATRMVFSTVGTMLPKVAMEDISVWGVGRVTTAAVGDPVKCPTLVECQEYLTRRLLTCCLGTSTRTAGLVEVKSRSIKHGTLLAVDLLQSPSYHFHIFVQSGLFWNGDTPTDEMAQPSLPSSACEAPMVS